MHYVHVTERVVVTRLMLLCLRLFTHHGTVTIRAPTTSHNATTMSSAKPQIKRTYGARPTRPTFASSGSSDASSSPPRESHVASTFPAKRKRPLSELFLPNNAPPVKKRHLSGKPATKKTALTQLHFITDAPILRTCSSCDLTYTRGAPDDEALHKAHCARVQKGLEWGRDDEREMIKANVVEVQSRVKLKSGEMGRIVSVSAICGGKIGQKVRP